MLRLDEPDKYAANCTAVDCEIRNGDFQLVTGLVSLIRRVKGELGVQDNVIRCLVGPELNLSRSEVIGYMLLNIGLTN